MENFVIKSLLSNSFFFFFSFFSVKILCQFSLILKVEIFNLDVEICHVYQLQFYFRELGRTPVFRLYEWRLLLNKSFFKNIFRWTIGLLENNIRDKPGFWVILQLEIVLLHITGWYHQFMTFICIMVHPFIKLFHELSDHLPNSNCTPFKKLKLNYSKILPVKKPPESWKIKSYDACVDSFLSPSLQFGSEIIYFSQKYTMNFREKNWSSLKFPRIFWMTEKHQIWNFLHFFLSSK